MVDMIDQRRRWLETKQKRQIMVTGKLDFDVQIRTA